MPIADRVRGTHAVLLEIDDAVRGPLEDRLQAFGPLSIVSLADRTDLTWAFANLGRPITVILELTDRLDDRLDLARWIDETADDEATSVLLIVPDTPDKNGRHGDGSAADRIPGSPERRLVSVKSWHWPTLPRLFQRPLAPA